MMDIAAPGEATPVEMGINRESDGVRGDDGHRAQTAGNRRAMGIGDAPAVVPTMGGADLRGLGLE